MTWRAKALVQRTLAQLPPWIGDHVYHALQNANGLRPNIGGNIQFVERVGVTLRNLRGVEICGLRVLELGSGWFPVVPLILACRGALSVDTYDITHHYSRGRCVKAARALMSFDKEFARSRELREVAETGRLPHTIRYHPRVLLERAVELPDGKVDLSVSRFVLEHVSPATIERIHAASHFWMNEKALWIHWISPSDHRAYTDKSLHIVDFLRYSDREWVRIAGNRYGYHNRLRRVAYRQLFERVGWTIELHEAEISTQATVGLCRLPVHRDFGGIPPEELVAGSLWFALGHISHSQT